MSREETWVNRRQGRCWRFASASLDEASWALFVDGHRISIEAKPLELLHELLLRAGDVVTKHELLDAIWPGVSVVEGSLPTAVLKLRRALGDAGGEGRIVETVPRIGYRLAVPVEMEIRDTAPQPLASQASARSALIQQSKPQRHPWLVAGAMALMLAAGTLTVARALTPPPADKPIPVTRREAIDALRELDLPHIREMLARGWDVKVPLAKTGDGAIDIALEACEWNPGHDPQRLMFIVRLLLDSGAQPDQRNIFGDTPYSIAKAPRYCGPNHPVTRLLYAMCYSGPGNRLGDKCLASYEKGAR